ncbi:hypothetical protein BJY04DRAFT_214168 [Aspergillus karnatakaensis]|uniref:uncharacterized protein n=1 Tax=Aspergillus karnatakaensis TaxID=1810916 RepID=UPI003CCDE75C
MYPETFSYIFHHVILPPKLPGAPEPNAGILEKRLMMLVKDSLDSFLGSRSQEIKDKWQPITNMLQTWLRIDSGADLNRHQEALVAILGNLRQQGAITLYIAEQNCGWIAFYDSVKEEVIIDAFEASATSAAVLQAKGTLIRCFPGQSVALPADLIDDSEFCKFLAHPLCRLNLEAVRDMCPKAPATRNFIRETRDTVDPGLVTEGLMVPLLAFGENRTWKSFEKHVREEVNYNGRSILPWRRSPLWFVMKVAIQTIIYRVFPDNEGHEEYKNFMLYFAAEIGLIATTLELENLADVLAMLRAKIARRVQKLQDKAFQFVVQQVGNSNMEITGHLQRLHGAIQADALKDVPAMFGPATDSDLETTLTACIDKLHEAMLDEPSATNSEYHGWPQKERKRRVTADIPELKHGDDLSLLEFEDWVDTKLQGWMENALKTNKSCSDVADLIEKYSVHASELYTQDPVARSWMILNILELWVVLDKMCIEFQPLLRHFTPELPERILEPLLLPHRRHMERAEAVEKYIASRVGKCDPKECNLEDCGPKESIFADPGPRTFAVRYFDQTHSSRSKRDKIINDATEERTKRHKEWEEKSNTYQDLINQATDLLHDHEYAESNVNVHIESCKKCRLELEAKGLQIEVHEWPLSAHEDSMKNMIFELQCPKWFSFYRDITWKIVDDYGRPQKVVPSSNDMELLNYPAIKEYVRTDRTPRLMLASRTKTWVQTHYQYQKFPVGFEDITVASGLSFFLWDSTNKVWTSTRRSLPRPSVKHLCTLTVQSGPYSSLQYAVESSHHGQNKVLADQRDCHPDTTLHELCSFGLLRAGERTQWYNVARYLVSPDMSMSEEAVYKLFCQAAWELGSPLLNTSLREAHVAFEELEFVSRLLESLGRKLESIGSNWNAHYTLHILVILGLRTLSLCPQSILVRAADFLRRCRKVADNWCNHIAATLVDVQGEESTGLYALLFQIGGICLCTYSVEAEHLALVLESSEDLKILVEASIRFSENTPQPVEHQPPETRAMVYQVTRTLFHAEQQITELIRADSSGLDKALKKLLPIFVQEFCPEITPNTPFSNGYLDNEYFPSTLRTYQYQNLCNLDIRPDDETAVQIYFIGSIVWKRLLVLRGLFAHEILRFSFANKRWLVDYGIHPSRCLQAVPFRAKGVPSENSEFGHTDVALTLTCLSYYYQGLSEEQVMQCFQLLTKYNDPLAEYQRWIKRSQHGLPIDLHSLKGVNLKDRRAFHEKLYPHLKFQKGIIDFFLSQIVFPKEAREFPYKFSATAWDIPSRPGKPLTTGFSGTNDNRYLLPRSMPQKDLPHLQHTNAMVLIQLLRKENRECVLAEDEDGQQLSVAGLLGLISTQERSIQVIIDVGAQILELTNQDEDEPMVIDREDYTERLLESPYRGRMNRCLVFLDEHHSRGVDLKLPQTYRAAVTLGPRLTKDRLVQACNRMRVLDSGQSVAFFIPVEVKHRLGATSAMIKSFDVIRWVLDQTHDQLKKMRPLWARQGLQHLVSEQIWSDFEAGESKLTDITPRIQETDARSLSQLYTHGTPLDIHTAFCELAQDDIIASELFDIWTRSNRAHAGLGEEQERELAQEVEREQLQQICYPPYVESRKHQLHSDLRHFVKHGHFPEIYCSDAVIPVSECISRTTAAEFKVPDKTFKGLFATVDFLETVYLKDTHAGDEFVKPVHWVLSTTESQQLYIISQYEANHLLPAIRKSQKTALHMYCPRVTRNMPSCSKLDFLTIGKAQQGRPFGQQISTPEILRALEIFSGSLYFDTFAEYRDACRFFGFKMDHSPSHHALQGLGHISSEGFASEPARELLGWPVDCPFAENPLPFLKAWYSIRMKGQGFSASHIGSIVEAKFLTEQGQF